MKTKEYFSHEYNARNDPKLEKVFTEYGLEGIGLYWVIVESLYCEGGMLPLEYAKTLAKRWGTTEEVVNGLINLNFNVDKELFKKNETHFWSESALRRLEKRGEISELRSEFGKLGAEKRWSGHGEDKPKPKKPKKSEAKTEYMKIPDAPLVNLTEEEYKKLVEKHGENKIIVAISIFDSWLAKNSKKAKEYSGKAHYAHFRSDGWVWERTEEILKKERAKNAVNNEYGHY